MANPSVTYSFTNGTTSDATQLNQNFTDLINSLTDGTKTLTVASVVAAVTASTLSVTGVAAFTGVATFTGAPVFNGGITSVASLASGFYEEGTFTITYSSGATTAPTATVSYTRVGKSVTLIIPALTATSNLTSMVWSGCPVSLRPATAQYADIPTAIDNSLSVFTATMIITIGPNWTFLLSDNGSGWTNAGVKGVNRITPVSYTLQ